MFDALHKDCFGVLTKLNLLYQKQAQRQGRYINAEKVLKEFHLLRAATPGKTLKTESQVMATGFGVGKNCLCPIHDF